MNATDTRAERRAELEALARRWVSLWNAPVDWRLFDELHAPDFEDVSSGGRPPTKAGFAAGIERFVHAFPDVRSEVDDIVVDVDRSRIAVRWTSRGTNRERYLNVGPTGRLTTMRGIEIIELSGDRVVRRWGEWDPSDHLRG